MWPPVFILPRAVASCGMHSRYMSTIPMPIYGTTKVAIIKAFTAKQPHFNLLMACTLVAALQPRSARNIFLLNVYYTVVLIYCTFFVILVELTRNSTTIVPTSTKLGADRFHSRNSSTNSLTLLVLECHYSSTSAILHT